MLVEGFVGGFGEVGVAFCAGEFGGVFVGFFDEFFYFGAGGVVVEEFVVAFFDAWMGELVRVWEEWWVWFGGGRKTYIH